MAADEPFASVSIGALLACALRQDGTPICDGIYDLAAASPKGERFASISSGDYYACALRHNGSVVCWGQNDGGQKLSPPEDERFAVGRVDAGD